MLALLEYKTIDKRLFKKILCALFRSQTASKTGFFSMAWLKIYKSSNITILDIVLSTAYIHERNNLDRAFKNLVRCKFENNFC